MTSAPDPGPVAPVRVLIVDDDVPPRVGLRAILSSAGDIEVIGEASTGAEAIAAAGKHQPDIVLMDVRLPGMDGITATRRITSDHGGSTKVIVLTTFDLEELAFQARRAGASGFVLKRAPAEQLISEVRAVARETSAVAPEAETGFRRDPGLRGDHEFLSFTPPLTGREREVLHLVARGYANAEIGHQLGMSVDTVKSHLKHIYGKSGVTDRARLVVAAARSGFGDQPI